MTAPSPRVGIDFGTSSSAIAMADADGAVRFAQFPAGVDPTAALATGMGPSWRTLLFFDPDAQKVELPVQYHAGAEAIAAYLEAAGEGRLVQSFKTHLTSESLGRTQIAHHALGLEDMIALYLLRLRQRAEADLGCTIDRALIGRPVRFAGGHGPEDDALAERRLRTAATLAGFREVELELEPVGAAHHYARTLTRPELALVADFGAGTTDFCVMKVGPTGHDTAPSRDIVAIGGVAAAGDDLDAALIDYIVCPLLGKGDSYVEMGGQRKAIPSSYYYKLARWHHLSFLGGTRTRTELERLRRGAQHPERIAALMHIIETNQAFHLHKSVERVKLELSRHEHAAFHFTDGPIDIHAEVTRADFERWIVDTTDAIAKALDDTLARAKLAPRAIDCVFMTGGTAFVPAVRRLFEQRFGADKLRSGDELMSIASGLALRAGGS